MEAWCCKCKSKRNLINSIETRTSRGVKMIKGNCEVCNTKMCRMLGK